MAQQDNGQALRQLQINWNGGLIAASVAVSLLGAFTATQMMCQARTSRYFSGILVWTMLGSLTFGFCSIWSLHFIAMLACELPLKIGLDIPLTILSAFLAVAFTFLALAADLIRDRYVRTRRRRRWIQHQQRSQRLSDAVEDSDDALLPLIPGEEVPVEQAFESNGDLERIIHPTLNGYHNNSQVQSTHLEFDLGAVKTADFVPPQLVAISNDHLKPPHNISEHLLRSGSISSFGERESEGDTESLIWNTEGGKFSRRSSASQSDNSSLGLPGFMSFRLPKDPTTKTANVLRDTILMLYHGITMRNICKGFIWSLAIDSMHYFGIFALKIPRGHITLQPFLVALSAAISWLVCIIGCVLIPQIEVNLTQQLMFSVVAALGVAAMHFMGMAATTFWSSAEDMEDRGYPPNLAVAVTSIAILTCMLANGLLAHSATVARNKLAEVVQTKRKLWAAIAQKETAEAAAAARSEFIASASHEIRTPLHQLQGYSDLLARTSLSGEARLLLAAIQQATKSLSMITANVLDWSRLEKGEAVCRPTNLDLKKVCDGIITILPTNDETNTELMVVVAPNVPDSLFLDETYLQRILMNLLTNALKFTQAGYVLLTLEMVDDELLLTVRDSGYGIPESFLPHLFEPFKQAQTRGAERGTGLGLAIIRHLAQKMRGTITVDSTCQQDLDVGTDKCGSTFSINIPVDGLDAEYSLLDGLDTNRKIGIFGKGRITEGLLLAWKVSGFRPTQLDTASTELYSFEIIWVDVLFLMAHRDLLQGLLKLKGQLVLVPYDSQGLLDDCFGGPVPSHVIPVKRPFVWHRIIENMASAEKTGKTNIDRAVRFAPVVDIVPSGDTEQGTRFLHGSKVLLVEDNKINQRLGQRMLQTLGYTVVLADDGQDALEKLVQYDSEIDIILMDQSMPRMDGITATQKIREMEMDGTLAHARRPIIMVTAVVGPDAQSLCMSAGTDAFLPKPLALSKLDNTLKKFLG